jgi:hypothetical protein
MGESMLIRKIESRNIFIFFLVLMTLAGLALTLGANSPASAADPEPTGWYAGDMHVHRSCGGSPEAISDMYTKMSLENLAVIALLADMGNGEVQDPVADLPRVTGQDDPVSTPGRIVHWDAEWHWDATYSQYAHQALGGHIVALGLTEAHQIWEEYTYPIFNWARQQNAIAGFAHMEYLDNSIPQSLSCCTPIEYPVEVALGSADFVSQDVVDVNSGLGMCPECAIQAYYRLLNCGFRPGLAAGTDYPCNSSRPLGSLLTYVQVAGGQMTYRNWIEGIKNGRTVISRNGHNEFLNLLVNNSASPGDEVKLTSAGSVPVTITWTANQNLSGKIELVRNGVVFASQQSPVTSSSPVTLTATVDFANSGWLAARRMDSSGHVVHTAAVFVIVDNAPVRASVADARFFVGWMETLLTNTSPGGPWNQYFPTSLSSAQARYTVAKALYQQIESDAAALLTIATTSLPNGPQNVAYSAGLAASGGTTPYIWSITSGSLPTGLGLNTSTGVISGTPTTTGTSSFTVQVTDAGNPKQTANKALSITIAYTQAQTYYTIWDNSATPSVISFEDTTEVELGLRFQADTAGYITGIRFYKAAENTGTHAGNLWSDSGTLLASVPFAGETASGWQQMALATPVAIQAKTTYVVSYHTDVGHYSSDAFYFQTSGVDNSPLHALQDGVSSPNGIFIYSPMGVFPNLTYHSTNYWVDVVFEKQLAITTNSLPNRLQNVAYSATLLASGGITPYTWSITSGSLPAGLILNGSTGEISGQPTTAGTFSFTVQVTDSASVPQTTTKDLSITIQPTLVITTSSPLANGVQGSPYTATLAASGGVGTYTWALAGGTTLPAGLILNGSTGVTSGQPTTPGTFNFTVQVTDSGTPQQTTTKGLSIIIAEPMVYLPIIKK